MTTHSLIEEEDNNMNIIIEKSYTELNNIMNNWCKCYEDNFNGGQMRNDRGEDIETFCKKVIQMFGDLYKVNVYAVKGTDDNKELVLNQNDQIIKKSHQVDIHIYKDNIFVAVIECKSYLDSCYYVRACDDFRLFKKFGYNIKNYIFSLENSIDENTKLFTDVVTDYVCNDIFYILDEKRSSAKPIYNTKYKKSINKDKLLYFMKTIQTLLINS
jgi:hypothetical protein